MDFDFDVAIIGGGPSGSAAATYLVKKGYRVVVFEKEKFPREHVGESLIPFCNYRLQDLGVIDEVKKIATRKPGINFVDRDGKRESVWCFERVLKDIAGVTFHTDRATFDKVLLDHAAKSGATVRECHTVKSVNLDNPREAVLQVTDANGETKNCRVRFLLDASGQHTFLSKKIGGKTPFKGLDRVAFYRRWVNNTYDKALNSGMIKIVYLGGEKKGWFWVIPIGRNYLSIGVSLNHAYVRERKKALTGDNWKNELYAAELAEAICLEPILRNANPQHDTISVSDYSYFLEKKYGANYAMIGDAGAFLDPIFSSGLFAALETAYRVTQALDVKLSQGNEAGQKAFEETFTDIEGGYKLIEKFVRLFYDDDLLNFSHVSAGGDQFDKFTNAYNAFHYLLSGDFFTHYKKYGEFIDQINRERSFNQFIQYVRKVANEFPNKDYCRHSFEDVYGHLPEN
ncbi:MAG: FAD dependent oxidoreductase [Bacteroidetes bacterium]|nr:MAG: FAD dependent oxidoreductase [Bacteroidota bacterium]